MGVLLLFYASVMCLTFVLTDIMYLFSIKIKNKNKKVDSGDFPASE